MLARLLLALVVSVALTAGCTAKAAFPLHAAPNGRYLADTGEAPFLILGDAAWSLIAQLSRDDVEFYLADRRRRGFNTILVSLIEHKFATHAPGNIDGEQPFLAPGDFSRPNEAYFAHADWVLRRAAVEGFLVLLAPSYLGFNGEAEGWYREMAAVGPEQLRRYGEYLGNRYRDFSNIIWVNAGDYNPPDKSLVRAVAEGISSANPQALQTAHSAPETSTLEYWAREPWVQLNAVYTYAPVHLAIRKQWQRPERLPYFLIESAYENEHGATGQRLRMQAYQALLLGAAGQVFGNNPIWHFDGPGLYRTSLGWKESLDSEGARSMTSLASLMHGLDWWKMRPDFDASLLVDGLGPQDRRAVAAVASDGSFALAYLPDRRTVLLDLGRLAGPRVAAHWFDPSGDLPGDRLEEDSGLLPASGRQEFRTPPRRNAAGQDDWVLVLEARP